MEKKSSYSVPETKVQISKIRTQILAGSKNGNINASGNGFPFDSPESGAKTRLNVD
ncbi:MAG: hypothetical protein K6E54_02295 [Bacteroidaceae bacterium]|nr:hypothetical protein [Bacteroidaceae bacterium]